MNVIDQARPVPVAIPGIAHATWAGDALDLRGPWGTPPVPPICVSISAA